MKLRTILTWGYVIGACGLLTACLTSGDPATAATMREWAREQFAEGSISQGLFDQLMQLADTIDRGQEVDWWATGAEIGLGLVGLLTGGRIVYKRALSTITQRITEERGDPKPMDPAMVSELMEVIADHKAAKTAATEEGA